MLHAPVERVKVTGSLVIPTLLKATRYAWNKVHKLMSHKLIKPDNKQTRLTIGYIIHTLRKPSNCCIHTLNSMYMDMYLWEHPHVITSLPSIQSSISPHSSPSSVCTPIYAPTQTTVS